MAKVTTPAPEAEAEATEAPAVKAPKAPVNPQVPLEYKNETTGKYLPGRDARHASDVAKAILNGGDEQALLASLGSDKLREKAVKQVTNGQAKFATQGVGGTVIIKGNKFDARKLRNDGGVRVDGDNGWELFASDTKVAQSFESTADAEKSAAEAEAAGMAD